MPQAKNAPHSQGKQPTNPEGEAITAKAIIVSHGQPSDPFPAEADLADLARNVAAHLPGWQIDSATLANPGALDRALAAVGERPLIYPLFMTDGWFVRSALPKRLGATPVRILPPLGVDPSLPKLVADFLQAELAARDWKSGETHLLVASHGSGRSSKSKLATEAFVDQLAPLLSFAGVSTGYVEEPPFFGDAAKECPGQALCLPFFAAYGGHVKEDITEALAAADFTGPLLPPIGTLPEIPAFVAKALSAATKEAA